MKNNFWTKTIVSVIDQYQNDTVKQGQKMENIFLDKKLKIK